jgi:hypothetical protein
MTNKFKVGDKIRSKAQASPVVFTVKAVTDYGDLEGVWVKLPTGLYTTLYALERYELALPDLEVGQVWRSDSGGAAQWHFIHAIIDTPEGQYAVFGPPRKMAISTIKAFRASHTILVEDEK